MSGLLICSDIHGDAISAKKVIEAFERHGAERLVILGDILYHGPRNDLPEGYAPKKVIEILNPYSDKILAVRGNCEAEVDQMVLTFPVLADYAFIERDTEEKPRELKCIFHSGGKRYSDSDSLESMPRII